MTCLAPSADLTASSSSSSCCLLSATCAGTKGREGGGAGSHATSFRDDAEARGCDASVGRSEGRQKLLLLLPAPCKRAQRSRETGHA